MRPRLIKKNDEAKINSNNLDFDFLSKTVQLPNGEKRPGIDVETHCRITGYVAAKIISLFPTNLSKIFFVENTPLIAAVHDIGKINPDFQKMIYMACTVGVEKAIEVLKAINANSKNAERKGCSFHAKVSQIVLSEVYPEIARYIARIEGMHHGFRPYDVNSYSENRYGGEAWTKARHALLKKLEAEFSNPENIWQEIKSWDIACVIGGLIIVSDWIASGGIFSNLQITDKLDSEKIESMAEQAVLAAGFHKFEIKKGLSFKDIFGFEARSVQKTFFDSINGPGVYILEAPMGLGKTEAALYAAYKVLSSGYASGLYFALPTQLTSNKIYERVELFLGKILSNLDKDDRLQLLHGSAWMEAAFGEDAAIGKSWFDEKKRRILAPFAVGTVDQALMSVMDVKHGMVRAFGLAGKVVILDEIHSYDAYTGTILNTLVESLQHCGCTVILLSATLTSTQKQNILSMENKLAFNNSYPLVTVRKSIIKFAEKSYQNAVVDKDSIQEFQGKSNESYNVLITIQKKRLEAIEIALEKAETGEQVLWIENTVDDAQNIFKLLTARCNGMNIECGLIHSRFLKVRRSENEEYWVSLYGSKGQRHRLEKGRILVGTQILEQSLDIDADFLITALCPTDMLLQRIGRLWRHKVNNSVRPAGAKCWCMILAPDFEATLNKSNVFESSGFVYSEYVLCRSYEVWKDKKHITLPDDIRDLLESTYYERDEKALWNLYKDKMLEKKSNLENQARFTGLKENAIGNTLSEDYVQTRYSEQDTVSVLLVHAIEKITKGFRIEFLSGESIILPESPFHISKKDCVKISKALMENCVNVSEKNAPAYEKNLNIFRDYIYIGNDDEHPFRCAIVENSSRLVTLNKLPCISEDSKGHKLSFCYSQLIGYQVKKEVL